MPPVPSIDHQTQGLLQCVRTIIMVAQRKILELLHQQRRAGVFETTLVRRVGNEP
jgi:hypothetical protein